MKRRAAKLELAPSRIMYDCGPDSTLKLQRGTPELNQINEENLL
jgi:hypothetical protein